METQPGFGVIQFFSKKYNLVYFVTSNPGSIVFNNELVDNYSASLIALNASSGSIHFAQRMVHNDVWDYDGVGQPIIIQNFYDNNDSEIDLLVGLNKTGTIFAVNAKDGNEVKEINFKGLLSQPFLVENHLRIIHKLFQGGLIGFLI